jgi:hypothetical protein
MQLLQEAAEAGTAALLGTTMKMSMKVSMNMAM